MIKLVDLAVRANGMALNLQLCHHLIRKLASLKPVQNKVENQSEQPKEEVLNNDNA